MENGVVARRLLRGEFRRRNLAKTENDLAKTGWVLGTIRDFRINGITGHSERNEES